MNDGSRAVVLFNRGQAPARMQVAWTDIGYPSHLRTVVRDLWKKKDVGTFTESYATDVPSHGVVMVRITP